MLQLAIYIVISHNFPFYCQVPSRFKHLYLKHNALFASDVDATLKSLATGLKSMQSQRMSSLLVDVDAAMREADDPNIVFTNVASQGQDPNNKNGSSSSEQGRSKEDDVHDEETELGVANDVELNMAAAQEAVGHDGAPTVVQLHASEHSCGGVPDEQQTAVIIDSSHTGGDSGLQEDVSSPIRSDFPVLPVPTPTRNIPQVIGMIVHLLNCLVRTTLCLWAVMMLQPVRLTLLEQLTFVCHAQQRDQLEVCLLFLSCSSHYFFCFNVDLHFSCFIYLTFMFFFQS